MFSQLPAQCAATTYNLGVAAIFLASTKKIAKFHRFESMQTMVSF